MFKYLYCHEDQYDDNNYIALALESNTQINKVPINFNITDNEIVNEIQQRQIELQDRVNAVVKPLLEMGVPHDCIELETVYEDNCSVKLVSKVNAEKLQQHVHKMNQYVEQLMQQEVEKSESES